MSLNGRMNYFHGRWMWLGVAWDMGRLAPSLALSRAFEWFENSSGCLP